MREYPTIERLADLSQTTTSYQGPILVEEAVRCWRQLALAQTEIKGHMRVEDDFQARIAELEKVLGGIANAKRFDRTIFAGDDAFSDWARSIASHALKSRA